MSGSNFFDYTEGPNAQFFMYMRGRESVWSPTHNQRQLQSQQSSGLSLKQQINEGIFNLKNTKNVNDS